jgi:hypothetical protein
MYFKKRVTVACQAKWHPVMYLKKRVTVACQGEWQPKYVKKCHTCMPGRMQPKYVRKVSQPHARWNGSEIYVEKVSYFYGWLIGSLDM